MANELIRIETSLHLNARVPNRHRAMKSPARRMLTAGTQQVACPDSLEFAIVTVEHRSVVQPEGYLFGDISPRGDVPLSIG